MEPATIAALVGGAASLAKGLFSDRSAEKAAHINSDLQREFAQSGIRWKVADAKAAGIHPLYALGASTLGASPVAVGSSGVGEALGDIGQDVSRSIMATQTARERADEQATAFMLARARESDSRVRQAELDSQQRVMFNYQVERAFLENELLKRRIAGVSNGQIGPPLPSGSSDLDSVVLPGGGAAVRVAPGSVSASDVVTIKPSDVVSSQGAHPSVEAGHGPALSEVRVGDTRVLVPSASTAQKTQNIPGMDVGILTAEMLHRIRNAVTGGRPPPAELLPPGYVWEWSMWDRSWSPVPAANWSRSLGRGRGSSSFGR